MKDTLQWFTYLKPKFIFSLLSLNFLIHLPTNNAFSTISSMMVSIMYEMYKMNCKRLRCSCLIFSSKAAGIVLAFFVCWEDVDT